MASTTAREKVQGAPRDVTNRHLNALVRLRQRHEQRKGPLGRAADFAVGQIGTPQCLGVHLILVAAWVLANTGRFPGVVPFDPYPFPLLATITCVEAILLAILILTTQNRQARLAERRADLDLHVSLLAEHEATRLIALAEAIAQRVGVDPAEVAGGEEIGELKEVLKPGAVMRELERVEEKL
jgi:uncharacterized membrane protein